MKSNFFISLFICFLLVSCKSQDDSLWTKKYCKLERLEFQEITDTVKIIKSSGVDFGVKINGSEITLNKAEIDTITADLKLGKKVFINKSTLKTAKVSQEFYEDYSRKRAALCMLKDAIKNKEISKDEGKERAERIYLDIIEQFSGIEKKK